MAGTLVLLLLAGCAKQVVERLPDGGEERGAMAQVNGEEVRHGVWRGTYPDGKPCTTVRYTRGVRTGLYREWYPNGVLAESSVYDWDGSVLKRKTWDLQGNLMDSYNREKEEKAAKEAASAKDAPAPGKDP